jgi:tetratricopeptide (TPR) repeat protein
MKKRKIARSKSRNKKISLNKSIHMLGNLAIDQDEASVIESIEGFEKLLSRPRISKKDKENIIINLAIAYKHRGEHKKAIDTLEKFDTSALKNNTPLSVALKQQYATSYAALGYLDEACDIFVEAIEEIRNIETSAMNLGGLYLEAGKAFSQNNIPKEAEKYWEKACAIFEEDGNEIQHLARAKANLGFSLLNYESKEKQEEGIALIEKSSELKRMCGDIDGLSSNYCNLGIYYWRQKNFEKAIAFTRKDLFFSRKVGDLRSIGATLGNLAAIYTELKQLSPARDCLREAIEIGKKLSDERLITISEHILQQVNNTGKEAGTKGFLIGPSSPCGCESGKTYQDCCGKADFEPVDIKAEFGGVAEEVEPIINKIVEAGGEPSRLDFIFRNNSKSAESRYAWTQYHSKDGWFEMYELPDMANHHLIAARLLAEEVNSEKDSDFNIHKPISCLLLSACALEAFINQVAYFLHDVQKYPEKNLHIVPEEIREEPFGFQRTTELTLKWEILGKALCNDMWPPPAELWSDVKYLINVRNELVHFKVGGYEQVVPIQDKHPILSKAPKSIQMRKIPHAWPSRLLTPSFAKWAVKTSENLICYLKDKYMESRIKNSKTET